MKIKTVDEKPMVIHQKKNPRLHLYKGIKAVRHKKAANTVRISRKSGGKAKEKEKVSAGTGERGWKERADSSIKVKNQRLKTFASAGARYGMKQVEGGEEAVESADVMMAVSSPVVSVSDKATALYRRRRRKRQE